MSDGTKTDYEKVEPTTLADTYGLRFEQHVLWLLLNRSSIFKSVHKLLDETLYTRDELRRIVVCMREYLTTYKALPKQAALIADLRGKLKRTKPKSSAYTAIEKAITYATKVCAIKGITAHQEQFVHDKIASFILHRSMHSALMQSAEKWSDGDYTGIVKTIQTAFDDASRMNVQDLGVEYAKVKTRINKYKTTTKNVVRCPVGIPLIDSIIRGGLEPGTLSIIMAPTGKGKTMLMVHLGVQALLVGLSVVHITLEISDIITAQRYDARLTSIPINDIAMNPEGFRGKLVAAAKRVRNGSLFIKKWGASEATTYDIRGYLNVLKQVKGVVPNLLLVDYADLLRASTQTKPDQKRFDLALITRELRQIADDYNCAVVTASQTGRSSFSSKVLQLSDVWECLEKVQVADVVLGVCQTDNERRRNLMRMAVLKNRLGGHEGRIVDCQCFTETQLVVENKAQAVMAQNRSTRGGTI